MASPAATVDDAPGLDDPPGAFRARWGWSTLDGLDRGGHHGRGAGARALGRLARLRRRLPVARPLGRLAHQPGQRVLHLLAGRRPLRGGPAPRRAPGLAGIRGHGRGRRPRRLGDHRPPGGPLRVRRGRRRRRGDPRRRPDPARRPRPPPDVAAARPPGRDRPRRRPGGGDRRPHRRRGGVGHPPRAVPARGAGLVDRRRARDPGRDSPGAGLGQGRLHRAAAPSGSACSSSRPCSSPRSPSAGRSSTRRRAACWRRAPRAPGLRLGGPPIRPARRDGHRHRARRGGRLGHGLGVRARRNRGARARLGPGAALPRPRHRDGAGPRHRGRRP